jgi:prophage antirepressor-like protein
MSSIFKTLENNYIKYGKYKIRVAFDRQNTSWFHAGDITSAMGYKNKTYSN